MPQPSRKSTLASDDARVPPELAAQVEAAARALLAVSARASTDLPGDVSLTQLRALAAVEDLGPCRLGTLAEALMISVSSASRLVDRIAALGLLDRRPSQSSRRELTLQVTARGRRILRRHEASRRAVFAEVLRGMRRRDVDALLQGLAAVQGRLETHDW